MIFIPFCCNCIALRYSSPRTAYSARLTGPLSKSGCRTLPSMWCGVDEDKRKNLPVYAECSTDGNTRVEILLVTRLIILAGCVQRGHSRSRDCLLPSNDTQSQRNMTFTKKRPSSLQTSFHMIEMIKPAQRVASSYCWSTFVVAFSVIVIVENSVEISRDTTTRFSRSFSLSSCLLNRRNCIFTGACSSHVIDHLGVRTTCRS
jgi:hypothetical protein